jgi:murein DD-endopeptidase MepM/ murein hydrolase activator NlpD
MMEQCQLRFSRKLIKGISSFLLFILINNTAGCQHSGAAVEGTPIDFKVQLPTETLVEGGFFQVLVTTEVPVRTVSAKFMGRDISFYPIDKKNYGALVGVDVDYKTGENAFEITVEGNEGRATQTTTLNVVAGEFPSETLSVQPRKVQPLKKDLPRIKREMELVRAAYASSASKRYWDPPLVIPVEDVVTSIFGSKRVYNGIKQSAHYGTDIRAKVGTPIKAPISGRVAMAKNLFYTGNTVILDHGFGFFTVYAHMSKMQVKMGQEIKKGQKIGLSGATGRVSGPHLHWGAQLHGVKIDPMRLVENLK